MDSPFVASSQLEEKEISWQNSGYPKRLFILIMTIKKMVVNEII